MSRKTGEIFLEAREMPAAKRTAFLAGACGQDLALRAKVEALLKADAEAGNFMAAPHAAAAPSEQAGAQIGRYKLLEKIGEGGMGTIWMAEQREPVRRRVALKIIKLGMDTKQVIARFEAERQALALMDHPHIAKVLDAGATETGRPYFVMEYIRGVPILQYCDTERLDTRSRLELFTSVCHAIQHAHHKGIIHRDIKPSNVLVTLHDGVPVPKVIDFGIAKATNSELTTKTLFTEHRQMIGTPAYMSPEQAEMSGLDIDTRSDIYSLGVLLYELLTGTTPFDMKALLESGLDEMLRTIREDEPHKPSTRISTLGDTGTRTAQQRRVELRKLSLLLRGELDWIVMKCLEKDRTRRYETANGLASDLKRHLSDEPVTAGPPSSTYRMRKFVRRHRVRVIAACVVLVALLAAIVGTSWGLVAQSRANSARLLQQIEDEQRSSAENARLHRNGEAVAALLEQCADALRAVDAPKATVALDAARVRVDDGGAEAHAGRLARLAVDLELLNELDAIDQVQWTWTGGIYGNMPVAATRKHEALRRYGADPESVSVEDAVARVNTSAIRGRIVLVMNWLFLRQHDAEERPDALREVLDRVDSDDFRDAFRDAVIVGDDRKLETLARDPALLEQPSEFTAALGQSRVIPVERRRELLEMAAFRRPSDLPLLMALQGLYGDRKPDTATERIRWLQAALATDPQNLAAYTNLGVAMTDASRLEEGAACHRRAIELAPSNAMAWSNLGATLEYQAWSNNGTVLVDADKRDAAVACYRKAVELDPTDATAQFNLGLQLSKLNRKDEAIACFRRCIEHDPKYPRVHGTLAEDLWTAGRLEEAVGSFRKQIEVDPKWATPWKRLGDLLAVLGRTDEEIECFRRAVALDPTEAYVYGRLGSLLRQKGQVDEAILLLRKAIEIDPAHDTYGSLAMALKSKGQVTEAIVLMRKSLELRPEYTDGMTILSETLAMQGQVEEALTWARKAVEMAPESAPAHFTLGLVHSVSGQMEEALVCFRKAIERNPDYAEAWCNVGLCLERKGLLAESLKAFRRGHELGSKRSDWRYPSAVWVRQAEMRLGANLSAFLAGEIKPADDAERLAYATMCVVEGHHWAAVELYTEAFDNDPALAEDLGTWHRYNAACAAARVSAGLDEDSAQLDDRKRARLREQALDWLRADLVLLAEKLQTGKTEDRAAVQSALHHWQEDADLASIRDSAALASLPTEEREAFTRLWTDVAAMLNGASR